MTKINSSPNTLAKLIYLIILIFCFSICLLSFFIYNTSSNLVTLRAEKETLNISHQVAEQLNDFIIRDISILKSISQMIQTATNINDAIVEQLKVLNQFEHIFIVNDNGRIANIGPYKFNKIGLNIKNTSYIKYVMKEKKPFVSTPQEGFWGYKAIVIAIPIFLDVGSGKWEFSGVICGTLKLENMFKPLNEFKAENYGFALIMDANGNILNNLEKKFSSVHKFRDLDNDSSNIKNTEKYIINNKSGISHFFMKNIEYIVGFKKMEIQNWSVLVSLPVNEVLIDVYQLRRNTFILTSIFLLISIIFTVIIQNRAQKLHLLVSQALISLRNLQTKLVSSSKMSALGEMAGGVAHEINTPLGVITLRASQIKRVLDKEPINIDTIKNYIDIIEKVAQQIAKIVLGLRSFSRSGDQDKFILTSLRSIFDNTFILCSERLIQREVKLIDELNDNNLSINCRSVQISQVLLNLINNACDAIMNQNDKWIKIFVDQTESVIKINVMNSGEKISKDIQDKIMQPFFTTKDIGQGTGLGLSISKGIIESHGGKLYLDTLSKHTVFIIEIPKK
ncbi:GHKL domain-containing protein [Silvanigrella paludirubra]|uniref:histidine kinase n=1 Tax=Silvanigrella paludirubra TaxID=2499159 RepID=A0A6N6VY34_9BACT|nr:sensor histidine kinase [Silvanigrella paludirubra]KAB8040667.1 GHKL domain-containing protein [Silvanigrella paludirubra]